MTARIDTVVILDFGSQYTQLIARRVREAGVRSEILPFNASLDSIRAHEARGLILSGSPSSVNDAEAPMPHEEVYRMGVPVLGICYGLQVTAHLWGGAVSRSTRREYGHANLLIDDFASLFRGFDGGEGKNTTVWMSHGDKVDVLPKGFRVIGHTGNSPYAAVCNQERQFWGLQFHPEVAHTPEGYRILQNFLFGICQCEAGWTMANFRDQAVAAIREQVGSKRVLCALSGGVDSSVVALLLHEAIGDRLTCVFVDNGLLRKNERQKVESLFKDRFHLDLRVVDAGQRFLDKLAGVTDPERKRKIIGAEFIAVFEDAVAGLSDFDFLAQGTLYPDVIESVSVKGPSATIKSHHNVGGLPEKMKFKLVEPLRDLFKDEVRVLALELGLPREMAFRQPFPGPGLAVRVLGPVSESQLAILREADAIIEEEIFVAEQYYTLWQSFGVLLPVHSVGVMGDERTYNATIALRAVHSLDGMTADWARLPYELLATISNRIINEVPGVNRVVYDISSKPPATIEWE